MKKIPTLFNRVFEDHKLKETLPVVIRGMEWVMRGEGYPTVKMDGACCAIIGGKFYKRFDAKNGKTPPAGAIPCCKPDPVTGHWPHWIPVDENNPGDRWFVAAKKNTKYPPSVFISKVIHTTWNMTCLNRTDCVSFQISKEPTKEFVLILRRTKLKVLCFGKTISRCVRLNDLTLDCRGTSEQGDADETGVVSMLPVIGGVAKHIRKNIFGAMYKYKVRIANPKIWM